MKKALLFALSLIVPGAARAESYPDTSSVADARLWPGIAPGSENAPEKESYSVYGTQGHRVFRNIAAPMLTAFHAAKPNGAAVLVIPGGGYKALYFDDPPVAAARWLNTLGIDAFVLKHRLPDESHAEGHSVPLQDAQRALRLIRSGILSEHAGHKLDPSRVGAIGFSAGGHLAAVLATYHGDKVYDAVDDTDALSARPDFIILAYAPLPEPAEMGDDIDQPQRVLLYKHYRVLGRISSATPPAFVFAGDKDALVPYSNSVRFAEATNHAGASAELHIFPGAPHSIGLNATGPEKAWPDLCAAWLRARGFIP